MTKSLIRKIVIAVLTVIIVFAVFSAVAMIYIFPQLKALFSRSERPQYSEYIPYDEYKITYPREEFTLLSGKNNIQCYRYGVGNTGGLVIISPGIGEGADSMLAEMMRFVNAGYQVVSFDPSGVWNSEGDSQIGLTQEYLDLDAVLTWVEEQEEYEDFSIYLYGFSSGGYASATALGSDHYITAAVAVSAFDNPLDIIDEWTRGSLGILAGKLARPYIALYNFVKFGTKSNISATDAINSCDTPILIFHGSNDGVVSYSSSSIISHQSEFTNPNARAITCSNIGQNDHATIFLSRGAVEQRIKKQQELAALSSQYGKNVPADVYDEYYASLDYDRLNRLDDEFFGTVLDFFESNKKEVDLIKQLLDGYVPPKESTAE